MNEDVKKAFDFASETTKQLITLSTGIITITITFAKDILPIGKVGNEVFLVSSWISFLVSIILGVWTLMALTGELEQIGTTRPPSIRKKNVTVPSAIQILTFLIGVGLTVTFGILSLT